MTLRVKLEIVPYGDEDKAREIGRLDIFNKTGGIVSRYGVIEMTPGTGGLHNKEILHRRDLGAWKLVKDALDELGIEGP